MKKNKVLLSKGLAVLLVAAGCSWALAAEKKPAHPQLSEQERYIACDACHQENTPDLYQEWYDSRHGMAMVKCYQCHGTFETFRITPKKQDCAVCHENMLKKCPQDKACWQCHIPHSFKLQEKNDSKAATKP